MKIKTVKYILSVLLTIFAFTSCDKNELVISEINCKMRKLFLLIMPLFFMYSCDDTKVRNELQVLPTTSIEVTYPLGAGTSGEKKNGLLGYGYDATGLCDTISVKAKVFDSIPSSSVYFGNPSTTFPTLIHGVSFEELLSKINNPNILQESGEALTLHLKSLIHLTLKIDDVKPNYTCTYYALNYINSHRKFYFDTNPQNHINETFKSDRDILSPKELVSKYGTHILTDVYTGYKFEVLYLCKFNNINNGNAGEQLFYNRMKQFIGGTPGIINDFKANTKLSQTDEQLIYNSIGSSKKICGVINTTDYNPSDIKLDINSLFNVENIKTQFVTVGENGLLPLYELISNETKKQEVKTYIETYMASRND